METRFRALTLASIILIAGCQGGASTNDLGSSVPATGSLPPSVISLDKPPAGGTSANASPSPTANPSGSPSPAPTSTNSLGLATSAALKYTLNLQTDIATPFNPVMEYSAAIVFAYGVGVDQSAFTNGLQITPATAFQVGRPFVNQGGQSIRYPLVANGTLGLRLRYVPGTSYHIVQPAFGVDITVSTPRVSIPAPIAMRVASPYYYGFLDHPFNFDGFLGGLVYGNTTLFNTLTATQQASLDAARATVQQIAQSGAGYIRLDFCSDQSIGHLAPYTTPHWASYDAILDALAAIHVTVLPEILQYCAAPYMFQVPDGSKTTISTPAFYASFASAVATHLKNYPNVTRVELFNEPNLNGGWAPGTPAYASTQGDGAAPFMQAAYSAIKTANPNLMVVAGALAAGGHHVDPRKWIASAYNAGCKLGVCWDEISQHNYRWTAPTAATNSNYSNYDNRFDIYKDIQKVAVAHGDPVPKIMLTEWGYSTCPDPVVCYDPSVQALYMAQGLNLALADPTIDGVTYVNVYNGGLDFWANTALVNNDRSLKPAFAVYQQFAAGSRP